MPNVAVYNKDGATVGEITLSDAVFGQEVNPHLLHEVVQMHLANQRQGTHDTKNRSEVAGGGRKPWRQKGTGRARQGSIRAPQWRKGGVVFGPTPREHGWTMPKKARRVALRQALSAKVAAGDLIVLESFAIEAPRTREVATLLRNLNVGGKAYLIYGAENDPIIYKSTRNIPGAKAEAARNINVYDVLNGGKIVMLKDAVAKIEEVLA
jgi:large subunit ribosomal protein L4